MKFVTIVLLILVNQRNKRIVLDFFFGWFKFNDDEKN